MNDEDRSPPIQLEDTLRYLAVADEFRRQRRAVEAHLEVTDRERLREHLLRQYEQGGIEEDPTLIDEAIDTVLSQKFRFREPRGSALELRLATCYVLRRRIALFVGVPAVGIAAVFLIVHLVIAHHEEQRLQAAERAVEMRVTSLSRLEGRHRLALEQAVEDPLGPALLAEGITTFRNQIQAAQSQLDEARTFLATYSPAGERVTRANYTEVDRESDHVADGLDEAGGSLAAAEALLERERGLRETRERLETLIAVIRAADPPAALAEQAERIHKSALASLGERDLDEAAARHRELEAILAKIQALATLSTSATQTLESIRAMAIEDAVKTEAAGLHAQATQFAAAANVEQLRASVAQLQDLEQRLALEYEIVIVGGVWRYKEDDRRIKNYYLRVQAIDKNRRRLRVKILNEENNREETVSEWAERVPKSVYDRVGEDKKDNGIIDDRIFGSKVRGELDVRRKHENLGQITRW